MQPLTFAYYDIPSFICILTGICYAIRFKELQSLERLIFLIIILNIIADTTSYFVMHNGTHTNLFYNVLSPVERALTLLIYARNVHISWHKKIFYTGMGLVVALYVYCYFYYDSMTSLHSLSNVITGFVLSMLSYFQLRTISIGNAGQSRIVFYFGLANLIYYTLLISAFSAFPVALEIGDVFASKILIVNHLGYTAWAIILIIGILWKKKI